MHRVAGKIRFSALLAAALILASCTVQFRNHGYVPSEAELANIIVGSDTRDTVASLIGRPTAQGVLESSGWYYVESRFRHFAYQAPREISRQVVAISFDARGRVANIERFGLQDGRVIALSRRITKSSIGKIPLLRRLLGNIGAPSAAGFL
jgi:outer membrane protein assembly factor BamE (lipoprotein component of BamABCDE complex)